MENEESAIASDCIISCALLISHTISSELQIATKYERALKRIQMLIANDFSNHQRALPVVG